MYFWTKNRRTQFRNELARAMDILGVNSDELSALTSSLGSSEIETKPIGKRTIERFLADPKIRSGDNSLSVMLLGLGHEISRLSDLPEADIVELKGFMALFEEHQSRQISSGQDTNHFDQLSEQDRTLIAIQELLSHLRLPLDASKASEQLFFRKPDAARIQFETYRYSTQANIVQKSFTVLHRPSPELPITRFANFFDHDGGVRSSDGLIFKFGREVVFWGQSDFGATSKTFIFDSATTAKERYYGLMLSSEVDYGTIAARFVMKRSEAEHHSEVSNGRITADAARSELGEDGLEKIRNRIDFDLETPVIDNEGNVLTQSQMVARVSDVLDQGRLANQKPAILRYQSGGAFNPADHREYTFNAALKIRS